MAAASRVMAADQLGLVDLLPVAGHDEGRAVAVAHQGVAEERLLVAQLDRRRRRPSDSPAHRRRRSSPAGRRRRSAWRPAAGRRTGRPPWASCPRRRWRRRPAQDQQGRGENQQALEHGRDPTAGAVSARLKARVTAERPVLGCPEQPQGGVARHASQPPPGRRRPARRWAPPPCPLSRAFAQPPPGRRRAAPTRRRPSSDTGRDGFEHMLAPVTDQRPGSVPIPDRHRRQRLLHLPRPGRAPDAGGPAAGAGAHRGRRARAAGRPDRHQLQVGERSRTRGPRRLACRSTPASTACWASTGWRASGWNWASRPRAWRSPARRPTSPAKASPSCRRAAAMAS